MMKKAITTSLMLLLTLCAAAQFGPMTDADTQYAGTLPKAGAMAPEVKLKTIDGKSFKLSKLRGHYVVLDFWASWCRDCRKDAPVMVDMWKRFGPRGVEFVGVSFDTDKAAWRKALEQYGIGYTQVSELKAWKETAISAAYGVKWIPSMVLIDPDGKVVLSTVLTDKLERTLYEVTRAPEVNTGTQERVTIDGSKGKIAAVIQKPVLATGARCPMVMLMHGFGGSKEGPMFEIIADSLAAHGIASIRFDFNGHGESEGDFSEMTVPNEIEDAKQVYSYVSDLRYVSSVALVGHSQGGVVASMTAGELTAEGVSAVVLMAPAAVLRDDAIRGSTFGKMYDPLYPPEYVELWGGKRLGREYIKTAFSLPIYETAAHYQGPALIVHGTGDRVVPYTYGERYHSIWPKSEYVQLDGFDHGFSQNIYRADRIVSDWLINRLKIKD